MCAFITQGAEHEKNIPAKQDPPCPHPRFPDAHGHAWRPGHHSPPPCQGPQTSGRVNHSAPEWFLCAKKQPAPFGPAIPKRQESGARRNMTSATSAENVSTARTFCFFCCPGLAGIRAQALRCRAKWATQLRATASSAFCANVFACMQKSFPVRTW